MRILFWCDRFWPHIGGIEVRVGRIVEALCQRGHAALVITDRTPPSLRAAERWRGMEIRRVGLSSALEDRNAGAFRRLCEQTRGLRREFRPDVEVTYLSGPIIALQEMAGRGSPAPRITSIQTSVEAILEPGGETTRMLSRSAAILAVSEHVRRRICARAPELAQRVHLLPNCLPMPDLAPAPPPMAPPVILCLGRLVAEKGMDLALRALARLDGRWGGVRMIVAGDGPERSGLEALAGDLGLGARVSFTGWVEPEAVPALINRATLLAMPARWDEPFGLVSLQAAQMARPVVASRMGANAEVVAEGETGLLVENEDPAGLADAVASLLADPARLRSMGERARELAMTRFGFDAYVARHMELFRRHAIPPESRRCEAF